MERMRVGIAVLLKIYANGNDGRLMLPRCDTGSTQDAIRR